jgi:hypothetical protein
MNESSIFDPQHSQQPQANVKNKPTKGRGVLTFNPLHPSQELPPEQLIRLLGMESKKTRKHMNTVRSPRQQKPQRAIKEDTIQRSPAPPKSHNSSDEQKPQRSENAQKSVYVADGPKAKTRPSPGQAPERKPADREERPEPQQQAGARHPMEYERNQPAVLDQRGPGWLLPALSYRPLYTGSSLQQSSNRAPPLRGLQARPGLGKPRISSPTISGQHASRHPAARKMPHRQQKQLQKHR